MKHKTRARYLWLASALALVFLLAGLLLWIRSVVEDQLRDRAADRGLDLEIAGLQIWPSSVHLDSARIRAVDGPRLELAARGVRADLDVFASWPPGPRSVARVTVASLDVVGDVAALRGLRSKKGGLLGGFEGAQPPADPASEPHAFPELDVRALKLVLAVDERPLLKISQASLELSSSEWRSRTGRLVVGDPAGEHVVLEEAEFAGALTAGRPVLSSVALPRGAWRRSASASNSDSAGLLSRLRVLLGDPMASEAVPGDGGPAPTPAPPTPVSSARGDILAPDISVILGGFDLHGFSDDGAVDAGPTAQLAAKINGIGAGRYSLSSRIRQSSGGSLDLDMVLEPRALRGEGKVRFERLPLTLLAPVLPPLPWDRLERARADGELELDGDGLDALAWSGRVRVTDVALRSERIGPAPVEIREFELKGEGTWRPASRRLELADTTLSLGQAAVSVTGAMEWQEAHYLFDLQGSLATTPCSDLLAAVPRGLLAPLEGMGLEGTISAKGRAFVDSRKLDDTDLTLRFQDRCRFVDLPRLLDLSRFREPFNHVVLEADGTPFEFETGPGTAAWTPIYYVSPFLIQAVISHEDGRFFRHTGFSQNQIAKALARNLKAGAYRYGASTITMQTVKNLFLRREKNLARKFQEAVITWWLEGAASKPEILELYLNVIEYGPSIYGIREASIEHFGVAPLELDLMESAFLATILPNPPRFMAMMQAHDQEGLPASIRNRMLRLLKHMRYRNRIDDEALDCAMKRLDSFALHDLEKPPVLRAPACGRAAPLPFPVLNVDWDAWAPEPEGDPWLDTDEMLEGGDPGPPTAAAQRAVRGEKPAGSSLPEAAPRGP